MAFARLRFPGFALACAALLASSGMAGTALGDSLRGAASAVEGDVVLIQGRQLRLHGIDAPDPGQTCRTRQGHVYDCGEQARAMLERLLAGREVDCDIHYEAGDGRAAATCRIGGISVAGAMVLRGWAFAAVHLAPDYARLQALAQSRRAGMWAGRVEAPWLWRSRRLQEGRSP
jgi:endonuclease YncB( thermonuclease family)